MTNYRGLHRLTALLVFLFSGVVYFLTMAPTLSFWDCGEFITASYTMSVPHPPGAPFFLILGRLFSLLPLGADVGFRTNLISVLSSALTVMFLYLIIVRLMVIMRHEDRSRGDFLISATAGLVGALAYAFSESFWFNAVETEVYAISMFFTAMVVWLIFAWREHFDTPNRDRYVLLIFYLVGLAIGVHLLNILALPAVFLVMYHRLYPEHSGMRVLVAWVVTALLILPIYPGIVQKLPTLAADFGFWIIPVFFLAMLGLYWWFVQRDSEAGTLATGAVILVLVGYFAYAVILIRSGLNPPLDENNPETFAKLVAYLNREQYGSAGLLQSFWPRRAPLWSYQIHQMYLRYLGQNFLEPRLFYGIPMLVGLWGLVHHFSRDWKHASVILNLFLLTGLAIVLYVNQDNPQPRERDYSYVGSFFAFAVWIGIGAGALLESVLESFQRRRQNSALAYALALLLLVAVPGNMLAKNFHHHSRAGNYVAWDYAYNILSGLEPNAVIFTNGDNDTFPLWYLQYVDHVRPDVRVINLSLLNTGWYIKQLRDMEPRVPIEYSDTFIDNYIDGHDLDALQWRYRPEPRKITLTTDDGDSMSFTVKPTMYIPLREDEPRKNNFLRVQDLMILHILYVNQWRKPVYFAVTVSQSNQVGLRRYLRMDGLAFKVVQHPLRDDFDVDTDILEHNLLEVYNDHYRNLNNPRVYLNDNIKRMLQNYRSAFLQLAMAYATKGENENGLRILKYMDEKLPEAVIPTFSPDLSLQIGQLYWQMGDEEGFRKRLEQFAEQYRDPRSLRMAATYFLEYLKDVDAARRLMQTLPVNGDNLNTLAEAFLFAGMPDSAVEYYRQSLQFNSENPTAYGGLISALEQAHRDSEALVTLQNWLRLNPSDQTARKKVKELRARLAGH